MFSVFIHFLGIQLIPNPREVKIYDLTTDNWKIRQIREKLDFLLSVQKCCAQLIVLQYSLTFFRVVRFESDIKGLGNIHAPCILHFYLNCDQFNC